jgi:hypothetical protein
MVIAQLSAHPAWTPVLSEAGNASKAIRHHY